MPTAEIISLDHVPGLSRIFLDHSAAADAVRKFYPSMGNDTTPVRPTHLSAVADLLAAQNPEPETAGALQALRSGAGVYVTGQQAGLFGGPLYTPLKAATALANARAATAAGKPHVGIFWLASEDHDFAEIDHVLFPGKKEIHKLHYGKSPEAAVPVGGIVIDETITPLIEQAWELLGFSDAMQALEAAYQPGKTLAQAFSEFYRRAFAAQGLLVIDAASREFHRLGAPVFQAAIERADELHAALLERNAELTAAGYHSQVAVGTDSSLLFLIDAKTGARQALKRTPASASEPLGRWQAGRVFYSTEELLAILKEAPERISPSALLRPVFQDHLLGTTATIGGPAEIAYFAQSAVLFERIRGFVTPGIGRFSATLIEPAIADLLRHHDLSLERLWTLDEPALAKVLGARALPVEGKQLLAQAGNALNNELEPLLAWMRTVDKGLGEAGTRSASKMRYQMNRLRNLAANFQLQKEAVLSRHAAAIHQALAPGRVLQERVLGAAYFYARFGFELSEELTAQATHHAEGHTALWL